MLSIDRIRRSGKHRNVETSKRQNVETSKRQNAAAPPIAASLRDVGRNGTIPDRAILLTQIDHGRQIVAACCEHSAARGVTAGMTVAHARALFGNTPNVKTSKRQNVKKTTATDLLTFGRFDVLTFPHEPLRDAQALAALARWMIRFAPIVAVDPPDGLLLDISGCQRLYPSEDRLLETIRVDLAKLGFTARAAGAGTFGCAWAAARFDSPSKNRSSISIIPAGREREHLAPMPVAALRLEQATIDALREVGIERVEHLYPIARSELAARFGMDLLLHLDRALSDAHEVADAVRPIEPPRVERSFDGPVKRLEAVMLAMRELVERIATMLLHREEGVRRLDVFLERIDAEPIEFAIRLSRPNRSARHLWSLLHPRLESVNLGYGVERIALRAAGTARIRHEQAVGGRSGERPRKHEGYESALGELIDAVVARFGPERIFQLHPVESHLPERAARRAAANSSPPHPLTLSPSHAADRPSRLLNPPEPVEVVAGEGAPASLRWNGQENRIVSAAGPERIAEEWWSARGEAPSTSQGGINNPESTVPFRDYFQVQDEHGRFLWIFRAGSNDRWYVHGEWA